VDRLLDSCPQVRILATSREALGVEGETRWLVPQLSAPERGRTSSLAFQQKPEEIAWRKPSRVKARSQLGEAAWEETLAQGRAMSIERAIEYALSEENTSARMPEQPHPTPEHPGGLTSREVEVLGLVAAGMKSAQIAKEHFLRSRTVETHLTSIYHKLGVTSRAGATRFALEQGLA